MKNIIVILVLISFMNVYSLIIESGSEIYELSLGSLRDFPQQQLTTEREKQGEVKDEIWEGPLLTDILQKFSISDYNKLQIAASDNYMVRLTKTEINSLNPIIAVSRNKIALEEKEFRLIVPQKRDMFWIRDIARIVVEHKQKLPLPFKLFIAEAILSRKPLIKDPEPFEDVSGYFLKDLIQQVYPVQTGNYLLVARDNIRHTLDFANYLSKAALIKDATTYSLESPQMPAGMWIKDLAYMQKDEIGIIFIDQFQSWQEVKQLLNWPDCDPDTAIEFNKMINEQADQKREFIELRW